MSNGHIPAREGENHISMVLLNIDAQVTILPGPLEGGSVQIQLMEFGYGSHGEEKLNGPCGRVL